MKVKDLREKSVAELQQEVEALQRAYFGKRMENATGRLNDVASLKYARRDVARAKTILTEKEKGAAK